MNIVVCIKQVPDVDDIKWTKENNLDRSLMLSKINLYDEYALNYAIKIKKQFQKANIIAFSMGPNQASEVLEYALAKGANRAILLSDKAFGGSDTLITAKILARAIEKYVPDFDIILMGQQAQDGDTAQVPIGLAQELNIIDIENVVRINNADKKMASVVQKLENKTNIIEILTPCIIALKEDCDENYTPKINDYIRAQKIKIETYNAENLGFSKNETGIIGSPTYVYRAYRPEKQKNAIEINEDIVENLDELISTIKNEE